MSTVTRPPLPPRRSVPPPPSRPESTVEVPAPTGIAARIASLQLDQIGRSPLARPPIKQTKSAETTPPPPPPRRNAAPPPLPPRAASERDPQLAKALSRKPPPPPLPTRAASTPAKSSSQPPNPPARRLPPMPARLPTPEPEPEYDEEPEEYEESEEYEASDEGYQSQPESCLKCRTFRRPSVSSPRLNNPKTTLASSTPTRPTSRGRLLPLSKHWPTTSLPPLTPKRKKRAPSSPGCTKISPTIPWPFFPQVFHLIW